MWKKYGTGFLLLFLLLMLTGCQLSQTAFARMAGDAGAAFAAASTTLTYAHEGKITSAYASSSFVNFQSQLSGLDQVLSSQQGAPAAHTVQRLLDLYKPAMQVVNNPCLSDSCNWRAQVAALDRASKAFLEAGS